jgi:hypothetical protein
MRRTASGPHPTRLPALLLVLALSGGFPADGGAQHLVTAAVGARRITPLPAVVPSTYRHLLSHAAPADTARRSVVPFLVVGALVGAAIGGLLAQSFHDSFCGSSAPGYSCSTTSPVAAAVVGAGVGLAAGAIVWAITNRDRDRARAPAERSHD